ncbi:MAG: hypothetical protein IIA83_03925 [Thaumarchaeota archaeon]|nr:hypothetical protein [Nitrososphaerota archaeon]
MNATDHIPLSKTVIEMCRTKIEKEDGTTYTDEQILEFIKSGRVVGDSKEFWKKRKEEMSSQTPHIKWEIKI